MERDPSVAAGRQYCVRSWDVLSAILRRVVGSLSSTGTCRENDFARSLCIEVLRC